MAPSNPGDEFAAPTDARALASATEETWVDDRPKRAVERVTDLEDELEPGTTLGRYVLLERVGAGGMGIVYAAYDPQLDRRVAVKLLHDRRGESSTAKSRLLREAQALARLDDPHVVSVHDVGEVEGQIYLAMEFIDGPTLGEWLGEGARSIEDILAVMLQAGHGLAAAHRVGLVHRDFKPDNVMLDGRGRPRVMDFGLARQSGDESSSTSLAEHSASSERMLELDLTQTGAAIGTPAYMAPEQHLGRDTDARSDQFSFCVTLFEALYGQRPFAGDNYAALVLAVTEGQIREPPRSARRVPRWLDAILRRGLASDPASRYPDMAALLAALADDPRHRRRRRIALGVGAALTAGLVAAVVSTNADEPSEARCAGVDAPIRDLWSVEVAGAVRERFALSGRGYAETSAARVIAALDRHADAWAETARDACEAHLVEGQRSAMLYERQMLCLERPKAALAELVDQLTTADARVVDEAVLATEALPSPLLCADLDSLLAGLAPPPAELASAVSSLRRELERAAVLRATGHAAKAQSILHTIAPELTRVAYGPVEAEAALERGRVELELGDYEASATALAEAHARSIEHGHGRIAATSATELVYVVGYRLAEHQAGFAWQTSAEAWARRVDPDGPLWAQALHNAGVLYDAAGNSAAAEPVYREALEIRRRVYGDDHPLVAKSVHNLGNIYLDRGEYDQAADHYARAHELYTAAFGAGHPALTGSLNNLGLAHRRARRFAEAAKALREATVILRATHGEDHPDLALGLDNLARTLVEMGELDEAEALVDEAFAIRLAALGPEHPDLADTRCTLAELALARDLLDQARLEADTALARYESSFGPDHPQVAIALDLRGRVRLAAEDPSGAVEDLRRALVIRSQQSAPAELAETLDSLTRAELALGQDEAARASRQAALDAYARAGPAYRPLADALREL